jgi:multidrug efflux pump
VVVSLKPLADRDNFSDAEVVARLRRKMFSVVGSNMFLQSPQDVRAGGRQSNATYQYTLKADDLNLLKTWTAKLADELKRQPLLSDVNTDQEDHGLESFVTVDRDTAGRLGLSAIDVDNTLYDAFGQRQVSTIYKDLNQYHVIMEVGPAYNQSPDALSQLYLSTNKAAGSTSTATSGASAASTTTTSATTTSAAAPGSNPLATAATSGQFAATPGGPTVAGGAQITLAGPLAPPSRNAANGVAVSSTVEQMIPLSAFAHFAPSSAPTAVNHQDGTVAATISFSLDPGRPLGDALPIIQQAEQNIHMPTTIQGGFQGTAKLFQQAFGNLPILVLVALLVIYIVLGVLYESYVHPLTVLSTLPSAGVGAALALILFKTEFSLVGFIGIMLLIGIVKKNAILIIDFAIDAERGQGLSTRDAVYQACMLRFRPIMMTTFAAILGALPLVISSGEGSELRRPLGITIIGGLMVSQVLTLLTTPVVYLYLDRWRKRRGDQSYLSRVIVGPPPLEPQPSPA